MSGEQPLDDAGIDAFGGAAAVPFQIEPAFEGVVDRFDPLADPADRAVPGCLVAAIWADQPTFRNNARLSSGDLILVREAAEDLLSADAVLGEVDLPWPGVSLSRWQLVQGAVRPGGVVVDQVFGSTRRR